VPGLLVFSLRLLVEGLLLAARGVLRALGVGRLDTDHVNAKHSLRRPVHDQLHHRPLLAARHRVLHRPEARAIDVERVAALARLALAEADRTDRRLAEHRRGHARVVHLDGIVMEECLGHRASRSRLRGRR